IDRDVTRALASDALNLLSLWLIAWTLLDVAAIVLEERLLRSRMLVPAGEGSEEGDAAPKRFVSRARDALAVPFSWRALLSLLIAVTAMVQARYAVIAVVATILMAVCIAAAMGCHALHLRPGASRRFKYELLLAAVLGAWGAGRLGVVLRGGEAREVAEVQAL